MRGSIAFFLIHIGGNGVSESTRGERSPHATRESYLAVGRSLVRAPGPGGAPPRSVLAHVRFDDVAREEGLAPRAPYHYWRSHQEFWEDLLAVLVEEGRLTGGIRAATERCASVGPAPTPHDIWSLGDLMFDAVARDDWLHLAVATLAHDEDDTARPSVRAAVETAVSNIEGFLARSLPRVGLAVRRDGDLRGVATAVLGLLLGLAVRHRTEPAGVPPVEMQPGRHASLFATAASAVILESCDVVGVTDEMLDQLRPDHQVS